jgi:hypothetical protein
VVLLSLPEYSPHSPTTAWDQLVDNRDFQTMVSYDPSHKLLTKQQIQDNFQVLNYVYVAAGYIIFFY